MDKIINGWFSEESSLWPGQAMNLEVEEVLHQEKSQFQDIVIFKRYSINTWQVPEEVGQG